MNILALIAAGPLLVSSSLSAAEPSEDLRSDSRAPYIHRINLYDADGVIIRPGDQRPYSPRATCGKCHDYSAISQGWHFSGQLSGASEPWIYTDPLTRTVSVNPSLTDEQFVASFARHHPGGGRLESSELPKTSGTLEIDCMICHAADAAYDPAERARQIELKNYRWAPTVAAGLAVVRGSAAQIKPADPLDELAEFDPAAEQTRAPALKMVYDKSRFDGDDRVLFNIGKKISADRCYFCHSAVPAVAVRPPNWQPDGDVHLRAGMTCTDCHRNRGQDALDHDMTIGRDSGARSDAFTCRGCHMGTADTKNATDALGGWLGAPHPTHNGIPAVHFEKLTCTACHSGPWPEKQLQRVQTSRAHALGLASRDRNARTLPILTEPIFMRDASNKIAPHRIVWPNYWADYDNFQIIPLPIDQVRDAAKGVLPPAAEAPEPLTQQQIIAMLHKLAPLAKGDPAYVSGSQTFAVSGNGTLASLGYSFDSPAAWPIAHDVRPARQSLGIRGCSDCHADDAPIDAALVPAPPPADARQSAAQRMIEFRGGDPLLAHTWALSFQVRWLLKLMAFASCGTLATIITAAGLRSLGRWLAGRQEGE